MAQPWSYSNPMALTEIITGWFMRNQAKREGLATRTVLADTYRDLARLANQLTLHAEKAPYNFMAERLRVMVAEKEKGIDLLCKGIEQLGARVAKFDSSIPSGKNHWERIHQDVEDQKRVEASLTGNASFLAHHAPAYGQLLRQLVEVERRHKAILLDLLARADPQAEQT